jgi:hypothetical protein
VPLENIPRIKAPSPEAFRHDYVRTATPVIITDLFDSAPIREIATLDRAARRLGDVALEIQPNYMTFLETGAPGARRNMSLGAYLDHVGRDPASRDLCVEFPTPESIRALMPAPSYCELGNPGDVVSATFVANRGNYNHLHFDDDLRDVLLYQVFGTKRFSIVHPREGRKLDAFLTLDAATSRALALTPSRDANGRVFLERLPEDDKCRLLTYLNAADALLHPGETLFIPMLAWHYIEYRDTSMSVTYRLGRSRLTRLIAASEPRPSVFVQEVMAKLHDEGVARRDHPEILEALERACLGPHATERERHEAVHAAIVDAYDRLFNETAVSVAAARNLYRDNLVAAFERPPEALETTSS